jgi:hypothetical protein
VILIYGMPQREQLKDDSDGVRFQAWGTLLASKFPVQILLTPMLLHRPANFVTGTETVHIIYLTSISLTVVFLSELSLSIGQSCTLHLHLLTGQGRCEFVHERAARRVDIIPVILLE